MLIRPGAWYSICTPLVSSHPTRTRADLLRNDCSFAQQAARAEADASFAIAWIGRGMLPY
jgi:hypothetical protein